MSLPAEIYPSITDPRIVPNEPLRVESDSTTAPAAPDVSDFHRAVDNPTAHPTPLSSKDIQDISKISDSDPCVHLATAVLLRCAGITNVTYEAAIQSRRASAEAAEVRAERLSKAPALIKNIRAKRAVIHSIIESTRLPEAIRQTKLANSRRILRKYQHSFYALNWRLRQTTTAARAASQTAQIYTQVLEKIVAYNESLVLDYPSHDADTRLAILRDIYDPTDELDHPAIALVEATRSSIYGKKIMPAANLLIRYILKTEDDKRQVTTEAGRLAAKP